MNRHASFVSVRYWFVAGCLIGCLSVHGYAQDETGKLPGRPTYDILKYLGQLKVAWLEDKLRIDKEQSRKAAEHVKTLKRTGPQPGQSEDDHKADITKAEGEKNQADQAAKDDQAHIDELTKPDAFDPFKNTNAKANAQFVIKNVEAWIASLQAEIKEKEGKVQNADKEKEQKKRYEEAEKEVKKDYPKFFD